MHQEIKVLHKLLLEKRVYKKKASPMMEEKMNRFKNTSGNIFLKYMKPFSLRHTPDTLLI